jgi:hypothetical protein
VGDIVGDKKTPIARKIMFLLYFFWYYGGEGVRLTMFRTIPARPCMSLKKNVS